ncbi:cilia- and flagella-associated protein 20-like [Vanessa atalanta]|uniref:cilia- and flagella-associated protein 20-like n=1 Tax=Vanessa atalanta TaxID=42275 RepID=UPI001FCCDB9A|nr:cilia- and flagella-associated protein 20-like [Vanessa atalanta]
MFKNTYQSGLLSIFYSCGSNPLAIWDMEVKNGHIKRLTDNEVNSIVLEIVSTNVATTFITCPKRNQVLGIKLPFLVMIVKNLKRYFSFEITIIDDKNMRRRFRISNFQSTTKIKPFCTSMPIGLSGGWNQIQFNLADFTRRAYGTQFIEALRVQVHANARLRRIYFSERLYTEEELPQDYKLYLPLEKKSKKAKQEKKEEQTAKKIPAQPPATEAPVEVFVEPPVESKVSAATIPPVVVGPGEEKEEEMIAHTESVVEITPETVVVEVSSKEGEETILTKVEGEENIEPTAEQITEIKPDEDIPVEE